MSGRSLRVVFFGTPAFAVPTLERLVASSHRVVGVARQRALTDDNALPDVAAAENEADNARAALDAANARLAARPALEQAAERERRDLARAELRDEPLARRVVHGVLGALYRDPSNHRDRVRAVAGDVTSPGLGLENGSRTALAGESRSRPSGIS